MAKKKAKETENADSPTLNAYLERVGAERLSFRRAMIKERSKGETYYVEKTLIKIVADGTVLVSRKEHEPTKEEAAAIVEEFKGLKFPVSVNATRAGVDEFLKKQKSRSDFHLFWDRKKGGVRMLQQRRIGSDGAKFFMPWTLWSDGEWRAMEPDGLLPFWKPEKKGKRARIMIHEGAKAAAFVSELLEDQERLRSHPWGEMLDLYEHWGLIGGALAPHRADYAEVMHERPLEVVYVCDNDYAGESALQEVSKWYGAALKGIKFDKRWKMSWDMADPMPENLFSSSRRWIGPRLEDLVEPATRATELVPPAGGKGRPVAVLKRAFKEEWVHSITPEVFIHRDFPNRIYTAPEFNNRVAPFSDVDDTARLIKKDAASKSAVLKYDPGKVSGIFGSGDAGRYINTHVACSVKAEKGDFQPWEDFMAGLVVDEKDRLEAMRWCATLIARPDVKMNYGMLLISENQGVGKGTLGEKILAPLVGEPNVSYPSEEEIVNSNFNYWLAHKRLAVVHEIYAGHSSKAYNRLKSVITDRYITVSKKFQANYEVENWMHIFACSNSLRAIQLSSDDRRWFVPKVTEEKRPAKYWHEFSHWLHDLGGLNIIRFWAEEFLKKNAAVLRGANAPWSQAKADVVEEGYSPGMAMVSSVLDKLREKMSDEAWLEKHGAGNKNVAFFDLNLPAIIKSKLYDGRQTDRLEKPSTLRKIATAKGWFVHPEHFVALGSTHARLICSSRALTEKSKAEILKMGAPMDLIKVVDAENWVSI